MNCSSALAKLSILKQSYYVLVYQFFFAPHLKFKISCKDYQERKKVASVFYYDTKLGNFKIRLGAKQEICCGTKQR